MQSSEPETKITAVQRTIIGIPVREVLLSFGHKDQQMIYRGVGISDRI